MFDQSTVPMAHLTQVLPKYACLRMRFDADGLSSGMRPWFTPAETSLFERT